MRVLWFTNSVSCYTSNANSYNGGGWITSLETEIRKRDGIELGVCSYAHVPEMNKVEKDGAVYYLLPRPKKTLKYTVETIFSKPEVSTFKHEKLAMPALLDVVNDFRPDVIQVFGSENIYGMVAAYVPVPVVLHIQGIDYMSECIPASVRFLENVAAERQIPEKYSAEIERPYRLAQEQYYGAEADRQGEIFYGTLNLG